MNPQPPYQPYAAPKPYVSAHSRARIVKILLIVTIIVCVASLLASLLEGFFPVPADDDALAEDPIAMATLLLQGGLAVGQFFIYVATVVFFLMWLYRCYHNLPAFGYQPREIKYSPGWAVGSFFVPFVSLVVPYRAVKELWRKSQPASETFTFNELSPPGYFGLWWAFWIISNVAGQIYFRATLEGKMSAETERIMNIVTDLVEIPAALLALMVVREIDRRQTEAGTLLNVQSHGAPPPPPSFLTSPTP